MPGINFFDKKEIEWADFDLSMSGAKCGKCTGFTLEHELDLELLYAAGNKAISIQAGNEKNSGTIKVLKGAIDDLWNAAALAGARSPLYIEFDVVGAFRPAGNRGVATLTAIGIRLSKIAWTLMQGDKKMEVELPYLALDIKVQAL